MNLLKKTNNHYVPTIIGVLEDGFIYQKGYQTYKMFNKKVPAIDVVDWQLSSNKNSEYITQIDDIIFSRNYCAGYLFKKEELNSYYQNRQLNNVEKSKMVIKLIEMYNDFEQRDCYCTDWKIENILVSEDYETVKLRNPQSLISLTMKKKKISNTPNISYPFCLLICSILYDHDFTKIDLDEVPNMDIPENVKKIILGEKKLTKGNLNQIKTRLTEYNQSRVLKRNQ